MKAIEIASKIDSGVMTIIRFSKWVENKHLYVYHDITGRAISYIMCNDGSYVIYFVCGKAMESFSLKDSIATWLGNCTHIACMPDDDIGIRLYI